MARSVFDIFGDGRNVDPFRLTILGFASIEHRLNEALAEAFDGELPDELRRSNFRARVALARALSLMPDDFRDLSGESRSSEMTSRTGNSTISALLKPPAFSRL